MFGRGWGRRRGPGLLALRHALVYRRPGLLGDHASTPKSVILVREGDARLDVFGAGAPEPAVTWLANQARSFTLLSPEEWHDPVRKRLGLVEVQADAVETWSGGFTAPAPSKSSGTANKPNKAGGTKTATSTVATRRLTAADFAAFTAAAPGWALRGWRAFPALIEYGAAFGVPHGSSFASLAWIFDQVDGYDAVSVYTTPRLPAPGPRPGRRVGPRGTYRQASRQDPSLVHQPAQPPVAHPRAISASPSSPPSHCSAGHLPLSRSTLRRNPDLGLDFLIMAGYPITLELAGRRVAVIGLGHVGQRKVEGLLQAGAQVIGVDPIYPGAHLASLIDYRAEAYHIYHLQDVLLVFAAATPEVNEQIVKDAKKAGVLVNSATNPDIADFTIPAIWRNGGVLLAVSTNGASPALSGMLRDRAAAAIGEGAAGLAEVLAELRPIVLTRIADPEERRQIFSDWGDPRWIDVYLSGGAEGVRKELERRLLELSRDRPELV